MPTDRYDGNTYYQYVENGYKNYFSEETGQSNKIVRANAQPSSDRCPVRILDLYQVATWFWFYCFLYATKAESA